MSKKIAQYLLDVLASIKMYHWFADNYDDHKIFDGLYAELSPEFDNLMEALLAGRVSNIRVPASLKTDPKQLLDQLEDFADSVSTRAARAPAENIMQIAEKYKYLLCL